MVSELKNTSRRRKKTYYNIQWGFLAMAMACILACMSQMKHILYVSHGAGTRRMLIEMMDLPDSNVTIHMHLQQSHEKLEVLEPTSPSLEVPQKNRASIPTTPSPSSTIEATIKPLWRNSTVLPVWMKDYLDWHQEQKQALTETNFQNYRYIIMIARKGKVAGGVTDRLRPLPAFLRIANATNRIFLIHWDRPAHLEEFLLPPEGGLDWRVPNWMESKLHNVKPNGNLRELINVAKGKRRIQACIYQSWNYGELYYDEELLEGEPNAKTVLREVWPVVFTPSPPVAALIEDQYRGMGIVPGQYATAHIRALYALQHRPAEEIQALTLNALNCTSQLRPGGPFYVASDSSYAMELALAYGQEKKVKIVGRSHAHRKQPLHIGHHEVNETHNAVEDFYDTFVDAYLISMTRCVAFGKGGYGRWGLLMGYNTTCHHTHHGSKWAVQCDWRDPSPEDKIQQQSSNTLQVPLFPKPVQDKHHSSQV